MNDKWKTKMTESWNLYTHGNVLEDSKKRLSYIDIARGISIILMVIGHIYSYGDLKRNMIFSFHMPLFVIVSGFFVKENETFKKLVIKIIKNLIIPYIITVLIGQIIALIINNGTIDLFSLIKQIIFAYSNRKTFFADTESVGVCWFLPFLAICKALYYFVQKLSKDNDILKGIICLLLTLAGICLAKLKIFLPWSTDVALASIIFYYVGNMGKKYSFLDKILKNYKIILCTLLLWIVGIKFGYIELAVRSYPNGLNSFVTAISGTIIIIYISKLIEKFLKYTSEYITMVWKKFYVYIMCTSY